MHKHANMGIDQDKCGPQWPNYYDRSLLADMPALLGEMRRRYGMGVFWPLEWRLVAQWPAAREYCGCTFDDVCVVAEIIEARGAKHHAGGADVDVHAVLGPDGWAFHSAKDTD